MVWKNLMIKKNTRKYLLLEVCLGIMQLEKAFYKTKIEIEVDQNFKILINRRRVSFNGFINAFSVQTIRSI